MGDLRGADSVVHRAAATGDLREADSVDRRAATTVDPPGADSVAHRAAITVHLQGVVSVAPPVLAPGPEGMVLLLPLLLLPLLLPKRRKRLSQLRANKLNRRLRVGRRTAVRACRRVADIRARVTVDIQGVTDRVAMGMVPAATVRVAMAMDQVAMDRAATVPEAMAPKAAAMRVASTR